MTTRTAYAVPATGLRPRLDSAPETLGRVPLSVLQLKTDRSAGFRREHFEPGEVTCRGGDHGDWLYIITDGEVDVLKRIPGRGDTLVRTLGAGECFGEIAPLGDHDRTATARSRGRVNVLAVDRDVLHGLFSTLPPLRAFVEHLIAGRMSGSDATVTHQEETPAAPSLSR